jgi:predicted RNA polymerase sigma factor
VRKERWGRSLSESGAEVTGLLALMLLIDARRPARTDAAGELIPMPEQDRTLWEPQILALHGREQRYLATQAARLSVDTTNADGRGAVTRSVDA